MEGFLERVDNGWVFGWAWDQARSEVSAEVDIYLDGQYAWTVTANSYRPDLESAGKGNGEHAFASALPKECLDGRPHTVCVRHGRTSIDLHGSPMSFLNKLAADSQDQDQTAALNLLAGVTFHSRFGGLWSDQTNATAIIDGKETLGWITSDEAKLLRRWLSDGYIILPKAVPEDLVDRLETDVEAIWSDSSSARCFVEYYPGEDTSYRIQRAGSRFKDVPTKLLDLYAHLESARRIVFHDSILRFLSLIFERPALAFQCLYFRWGSRQAIHQDSAFVKVSSPLEFAASWIALENIQPESGELEYYVGSHQLEDYLFDDQYKWMPTKSGEYDRFIESLRERSEAKGLKRERFLARKGDVLIWHADLAHGGRREVRPGITRKSIVTHYCPVDRDPVYGTLGQKHPRHRYSDIAYYTYAPRE
jgi:Phytanoyl-CoA dioxygenase (PhyH)